MSTEMMTGQNEKAFALLKSDAEKIRQLIEVQMENLTMPQCPLYEEVLDTQMFGLSREIDFAIRLELVEEEKGKQLLVELERKLAALHEASLRK
ncbi:YlaN family protein [Alkalihalobacillus sp. 1P02AB]|uniref:YlaN family protein n=1 Tax=Alkalihalobacillus sp. 1P02AB TaxID=3132260 RepID=UPI0039A59AC3